MSNWLEQTKRRIRDNKCVVCGSATVGHYNSFPLCRADDVILTRRIYKSENYARTVLEAGLSTAREICIDSENPEVAASFILVEYEGYEGMRRYLQPSEMELLEKDFPQVIDYLREWDSKSTNTKN